MTAAGLAGQATICHRNIFPVSSFEGFPKPLDAVSYLENKAPFAA